MEQDLVLERTPADERGVVESWIAEALRRLGPQHPEILLSGLGTSHLEYRTTSPELAAAYRTVKAEEEVHYLR